MIATTMRFHNSLTNKVTLDNYSLVQRDDIFVKKCLVSDFTKIMVEANRGHVESQYDIGVICKYSIGVVYNRKTAIAYLQKAFANKHVGAACVLAEIYSPEDFVACTDYGVFERAFKYLKFAADHGDLSSQTKLAHMYLVGKGVSVNMKQTKKYRQMADTNPDNNRRSSIVLHIDFENGERYNDETLSFIKMNADQGDKKYQTMLSTMYLNGCGVDVDLKTSIKYTKMAALSGSVMMQATLGEHYTLGLNDLDGEVILKKDVAKGHKFFKMAASQGCMKSQYLLGYEYFCNSSDTKDVDKAFMYFKMAADQGCVESQLMIGCIYYENSDVALKYLKMAEKQGDTRVYEFMSKIYYNCMTNTDESVGLTLKYSKLAAKHGYVRAMGTVGYICYNFLKDTKTAIRYLKMAVPHKCIYSLGLLGDIYSNAGTMEDDKKACKYYAMAAAEGCEHSQNMAVMIAVRIANKCNPAQIKTDHTAHATYTADNLTCYICDKQFPRSDHDEKPMYLLQSGVYHEIDSKCARLYKKSGADTVTCSIVRCDSKRRITHVWAGPAEVWKPSVKMGDLSAISKVDNVDNVDDVTPVSTSPSKTKTKSKTKLKQPNTHLLPSERKLMSDMQAAVNTEIECSYCQPGTETGGYICDSCKHDKLLEAQLQTPTRKQLILKKRLPKKKTKGTDILPQLIKKVMKTKI